MKNILFLTWKDIKHPHAGGAEKVIYQYAKYLSDFGHNVVWVSSGFDGGNNEEIIDGIKIIRIYSIKTIYFFAWKWYKDYLKNNKVDIIIDEAGGIPLFSPFFAKDKRKFFMIHHIADKEWDFTIIKPLNYILKFLNKEIIKLYKSYKTITVSESTKNELVKTGFNEKNIKVIENVLDLKPIEKIDFSKKTNSILFIGRLMPIKRVEDTIKAFNLFYKKNSNYVLNIVGGKQDKKYVENLEKLIIELGLEGKVVLQGFNKDIFKKYLIESKLLLVTSYKEGFGLIVLEGNAYGLPVIGYDVAGLRDSIKNNLNGFLVEDGKYEKIAEKMDFILNNESEYKRISEKSLEYVKGLSGWEERVKELEKFIIK